MMTVEQIRFQLRDRRLDLVAKGSGLSASTIRDLRNGEQINPNYRTIKRLTEYLSQTGEEERT
jgi:predicted transcriptional regulator